MHRPVARGIGLLTLIPALALMGVGCRSEAPTDELVPDLSTVNFGSIRRPETTLLEWQMSGAIADADVDGNGVVDIRDLVIVARSFGQAIELPPVRIATFNVSVFGPTKLGKDDVMDVLADIADEFDIMAVQEIRDSSGATPYVYLERMNAQGDEFHLVTVGPRVGRTIAKEQYAIYYDTDVVRLLDLPATYPDVEDVFEREPFCARLLAGGMDFVLVTVHTKPEDAAAEIAALPDVVRWASELFGDDDVIVLGDLNADGGFFDENERQAALDMHWITPTDFDTTLSDTDHTLDNFVVSDSLVEEFSGDTGVLRFDVEYALDVATALAVSDHYPVFAVFGDDI